MDKELDDQQSLDYVTRELERRGLDRIDDLQRSTMSFVERERSLRGLSGDTMDAGVKPVFDHVTLEIARRGEEVHKLKAKDSTGRWAYYYVFVPRARERAFLEAIKSNSMVDLEDYGRVIASNYGEGPSEETRKFLKETYGFDG